jgi:hypothetical protein
VSDFSSVRASILELITSSWWPSPMRFPIIRVARVRERVLRDRASPGPSVDAIRGDLAVDQVQHTCRSEEVVDKYLQKKRAARPIVLRQVMTKPST